MSLMRHPRIQKAAWVGAPPGAGFTLLEVLLALALISVVLAAIYGSFFVAEKAVRSNEDTLVRLHEIRTVMDVMRLEVEAALVDKRPDNHLIVRDRDVYGSQASELELTTHYSHMKAPARVGYFVREKEDGLALIKSVRPAALEDERPVEAEAVERIISFSLEARRDGDWRKTWQETALPEEVKITLTVPLKDRELTLTEVVRTRMGRQL